MAAQGDADPLPEDGSEANFALEGMLVEAVMHGDLATLQRAGAAALAHGYVEPLKLALESRQPHVVAWAVEESERTGIDIADGWKEVHVVACQGDMDQLRAASEEDLSVLTDMDGDTVLHAAAMGDQGEAIEYLVRERGLDVHAVDDTGASALDMASRYGCLSAIEALVACGARLHDEPGEPSTALIAAARQGQVAVMEKLVELGADIRVTGDRGGIVYVAARSGSVEAIDAAVRLGADPCAVGRNGATALHAAAKIEEAGAIRRLIQLGASINALDNGGRTALHLAYASPQACRTLLELGADRWIKSKDGCTARDFAVFCTKDNDDAHQVIAVLDTYWPIVPCMMQLLLGLRGPSESSLTRFAAHSAFEPKVLSLVNCLLTGKDGRAYEQLAGECSGGGVEAASSSSSSSSSSSHAAKKQRQG